MSGHADGALPSVLYKSVTACRISLPLGCDAGFNALAVMLTGRLTTTVPTNLGLPRSPERSRKTRRTRAHHGKVGFDGASADYRPGRVIFDRCEQDRAVAWLATAGWLCRADQMIVIDDAAAAREPAAAKAGFTKSARRAKLAGGG
jgi:hypothetical protein